VIAPLIDPLTQISSTSIDLRLGTRYKIFRKIRGARIDPAGDTVRIKKNKQEGLIEDIRLKGPPESIVLHPSEFALASTLEYIRLPTDIVGELHGRSSWGKLGLIVHATAGFVHPGFHGVLTLELVNIGSIPITLYPGVRIAHIAFTRIDPTSLPYKGKYVASIEAKESELYYDKEMEKIRNLSRRHKMMEKWM
jgi:dCTP deaminase